MTISSQVASASFVGNGTVKAFPCNFKVFDAGHVEVYVDGVLQTLSTHYTVSGVGGESFTVNFVAAPADLASVSVFRAVPLLQETDYLSNDAFPAETHERGLDLLTMIAQQINVAVQRSVHASASDPASIDMTLPSVAGRAGKLLAFDTDGEPVAATGTSFGVLSTGAANTWTALQTFQGESVLELVDLNPGPTEYGSILKLFADRATVATDDLLNRIDFEGRNGSGARTRFASINSSVHNLSPLEGQLDVAIRINNSMEDSFRVDSAGLIPRAGAFWGDATSLGEGPYTSTYRKTTPGAGDFIGAFVAVALNSADAQPNYLKIRTRVNSATAGAEDSDCDIELFDNGTVFKALRLRSDGIYLRNGARVMDGSGSPEGVVTAPVGSIFLRMDGGTNTTLYVKQSGTGNTGWAAK